MDFITCEDICSGSKLALVGGNYHHSFLNSIKNTINLVIVLEIYMIQYQINDYFHTIILQPILIEN